MTFSNTGFQNSIHIFILTLLKHSFLSNQEEMEMADTSTFLLKRCYPATTLNQVSCFSHAAIYKPAAAPATHDLLGRTKPRTATRRQVYPRGKAQTRSAASKVQGTNGEPSTFLLQLREEQASKASHKHHACCREHSYFTEFS